MTPAEALYQRLRAAAPWGPADERGTVNHVTPERVARAAALVRTGRVVSAAHDLDTRQSAKNYRPVVHRMLFKRFAGGVTVTDELTVAPHSFTVTHLDAVAHSNFAGTVYNGRSADAVTTERGLTFGSVHVLRDGIVTRGVLLDVAAATGRPWLSPTDTVGVAELERAERHAGVRVRPGDALLVRVGLAARERAEGPEDVTVRAGLDLDAVEWLFTRGVAVYGGDCFDQLPTPPEVGCPWPLHQVGQAGGGLVLLDNVDVEPLAVAVREEGRAEFLLVLAPLRLPGGTGSPVNPLCVF
ncbi:cyclase family protein [Micromonospora cathayae]|uniref:Cyclase family protein n=1 Tax=Micromonospora cathayae TaxID=3028804 RepID=A0ABY7ZMY0_9ACTN|nr:cyclase family protein [Micromonospora sp. HUAS 3]WDZ83786.1 cyclase family protein [Micromonospora sp. HUAS 3]